MLRGAQGYCNNFIMRLLLSSYHWVPSRGRSESAALGVCVYIKSLYTHILRVLPIHFGRETVPSGSYYKSLLEPFRYELETP